MMQAIILAAGMGKRLRDITKDNTKCMVKVGGVTLIERMLRQLDALSLDRIIIVLGYKGENLKEFVLSLDIKTPIQFETNPVYDKTNNIYSLYIVRNLLTQDSTLLLESDIIFEEGLLKSLVEDPRQSLALVDKYEAWMDGTCLELDQDDNIVGFITKKEFDYHDRRKYFKTVNIYKFSREFSKDLYVPFLEAYSKALGDNEYYEQVLRVISVLENPEIKAKRLEGQSWYEIDDVKDLEIANVMFSEDGEKKLAEMQRTYGGYWRYPRLLDFCYLVNPYYPPKLLVDELKSSFTALLTQYPSSLAVNNLLISNFLGIRKEYAIAGNGAAELIKELVPSLKGKIGYIRPTFEEYPNRISENDCEVYQCNSEDFSYTADDLIAYFSEHRIDNLILINPDNPSGNYLSKKDLLKLASWTKENGIRFIADESFSDFAEEEDNTLLNNEILEEFKNLVVVKSISKSYGVPGLRLGVLASSDASVLELCRKGVSIWNINSFAEYYLQIGTKYSKDYKKALGKLKAARRELAFNLSAIPGVKVFPSEANYIMAELTGTVTSRELAIRLLNEYNIFIKDLTPKMKAGNRQFIRVAVRTFEENKKLSDAVSELLKNC